MRTHFAVRKVGVRVRSKDRHGYITGDLEEDHSGCKERHGHCRVQVSVVWPRTVSKTWVEVSDIDPLRPTKKNGLTLEIRCAQGTQARVLMACGVPKNREQPITVRDPDQNDRRTFNVPANQVTALVDN